MNTVLRIENLNFTYPDGTRGLKDVDLVLERGSITALVGPNGSGKSTLLLHIMGLLNGRGFIEVCGIERKRSNMKMIRSKIGALFGQTEYHFIMPDVLNDVMLGTDRALPVDERRKIALGLLELFGLTKYAPKQPVDLSAGEMKKAAIAGVLAKNPEILILDEPLSNLDRKSADDLMLFLKGCGRTIIFSTHHRLIVKELAADIVLMDSGTIVKKIPGSRKLSRDIDSILF